MSWRGAWAAARITGVLFSTLVWIVVWALSLPALVVTLAVGVVLMIGRNTRPVLWWRFGALPANRFQRDTVLAAIIPIASLRGRRQPSVWIGRQLSGVQVVMPSCAVLVVSPEFVGRVASGKLTDRQASAIVCQALGLEQVANSALVNALEAYCVPWRLLQVLIAAVSPFAAHRPTFQFSWKIRWIVFGVAILDNYFNSRWPAFVGVILIAVLSWANSHLQSRWDVRCQNLGDQCAMAEGLGGDLADLLQRIDGSLATTERSDRLRRGTPARATGASGRTAGAAPPSGIPVDRLERRSCPERWNS